MRISLTTESGTELGTIGEKREALLETVSCQSQVTRLLPSLKAFMLSLFMKLRTSELMLLETQFS